MFVFYLRCRKCINKYYQVAYLEKHSAKIKYHGIFLSCTKPAQMKYFFSFFTLVFLFSLNLKSQSVGIGTNVPDTSAKLDVSATDKGFLPPRIALLATDNPLPVSNPATGLLVYNTAAAGSTPYNVKPGYYYWDGNKWAPVTNKGNAVQACIANCVPLPPAS